MSTATHQCGIRGYDIEIQLCAGSCIGFIQGLIGCITGGICLKICGCSTSNFQTAGKVAIISSQGVDYGSIVGSYIAGDIDVAFGSDIANGVNSWVKAPVIGSAEIYYIGYVAGANYQTRAIGLTRCRRAIGNNDI